MGPKGIKLSFIVNWIFHALWGDLPMMMYMDVTAIECMDPWLCVIFPTRLNTGFVDHISMLP